ncbi:translation elongation factor Ts [Porphyromonas macacae]|uniref:Elongation factor Ts n=1 Tax=Porphyromonas macacae TaxID=28115 RepID=A0A379DHS3_9PORP|nr:translation elongation factor Ts [Porphyromonas macacae]SUB77940.1 Elongation factor Ts [Porphyromonas macacae]
MAVTIQDIAKLRKMSGAGMMDCKQALEEANNDFEKAMEIIRKKGQAVAAKRSDREATEGCVLAAAKDDFAAAVALQCETDFVAKNQGFIDLTRNILNLALTNKPQNKEDLKNMILAENRTVQDHITDQVGITGEKMELGYYEFVNGPTTTAYIHPGNKLATIVAFNEKADYEVAHNIAMQVAAMNPIAISEEDVPQEIKERELELAREKARESGKPENLIERIAEGGLQKFYKENTLLQQENIKNNKQSVADYLKENSKSLSVSAFKRVTLNAE